MLGRWQEERPGEWALVQCGLPREKIEAKTERLEDVERISEDAMRSERSVIALNDR
jgi:hypothetical protein